MIVENVADDVVDLKSTIIEASVKASIDVKPSIEGSVDVEIPIQASVEIPFQASVEAKTTGVYKLHDYEVNIASFFFNKWKMARERWFAWLRSPWSGKGGIYYIYW